LKIVKKRGAERLVIPAEREAPAVIVVCGDRRTLRASTLGTHQFKNQRVDMVRPKRMSLNRMGIYEIHFKEENHDQRIAFHHFSNHFFFCIGLGGGGTFSQ